MPEDPRLLENFSRQEMINRQVAADDTTKADLAQQRFELAQANAAFNQAHQQAELESRIQRTQDLADHYKASQDLMQQQRDLNNLIFQTKQARQDKIARDAIGFIQATADLHPTDPNYDSIEQKALQDYPDAVYNPEVAGRQAAMRHERDQHQALMDSIAQRNAAKAAQSDQVKMKLADAQARIDGTEAELASLGKDADPKDIARVQGMRAQAQSQLEQLQKQFPVAPTATDGTPTATTPSAPATIPASAWVRKYFPASNTDANNQTTPAVVTPEPVVDTNPQ